MGLKYAVFHNVVHVILALILGYVLGLNYLGYLLILLVTFAVDLDHLGYVKKQGIKGAIYIRSYRDFGKARKYTMHHLWLLIVSGIFAFVFLSLDVLFFGVIFAAVFIHMMWDILEDLLIFKVGMRNWL